MWIKTFTPTETQRLTNEEGRNVEYDLRMEETVLVVHIKFFVTE